MRRLLAFEYLQRTDLVHVTPSELSMRERNPMDLTSDISEEPIKTSATNTIHPEMIETPKQVKKESIEIKVEKKLTLASNSMEGFNKLAGEMMGDAPPCNVCGNITIRSGTCYKCINCGNSMGCS